MISTDIITQFSNSQISELANLPTDLLTPEIADQKNEELLKIFAEYLAGIKTWEKEINRKIDGKSVQNALRFAFRAERAKAKISSKTKDALNNAWINQVNKLHEFKTDLLKKLMTVSDKDDALAEWRYELHNKTNSVILPKEYPTNGADLERSLKLFEKLNQLKVEIDDFIAFVEDYRSENTAYFYKIAESAVERFLNLLKTESLRSNSKEAEIFKRLPKIILSRQLPLLEKIANSEESISDFEIEKDPKDKVLKSECQPLLRKIFVPAEAKESLSDKIELGNFSTVAFNLAQASETSLDNMEEIETFRHKLNSLPSLLDRANKWLGAAKSCKILDMRYAAMGEGLLAYGLNQIHVKRYDHARKLLVDSLICLASVSFQDETTIDRAVIATMIAFIWPQFIGDRRNGEGVDEWIDNPDLIFRQLRSGKYLGTVAKIWADDLDREPVAEKFLEVVSANLGDDRTLFRICVERLLTPYNFIKRTNRLVIRLKWLIRDSEPSDDLVQELDRLSEEVEPGKGGRLQISNSRMIKITIDKIIVQLKLVSQDTVAPISEIIEKLPILFKAITKKDLNKQTSDPDLKIKKMVNVLFPDEKQHEIELPVMVRNDENSGPASNVVLILRNDIDKDLIVPEILKDTIDIGDLVPGQLKEAIFFISLPDDITQKITELRFKVEIRIGERVQSQGFGVKIRPLTRKNKSSPYVTGLAVTGVDFIGRKNEIQRLIGTLCGDKPNTATAVFGIRRIGKTSILKQTMQHPEIEKRYYSVFWDVEDRPISDTAVEFLLDFCKKIRFALPEKYKKQLKFHREEFRERPYEAFDDFLGLLNQINLPKRILIMIDEFDKLLYISDQAEERQKLKTRILGPDESFQPEVFAALRKALMTNTILNLVVAGMPSIMIQQYEKRIFGLLEPIEIKAFSNKEAEEIILSGQSVMDFSTEARDLVFEASGLQPYLLQVLCNELFHKMKFSGRDIVAPFDVADVIEESILPNEKYFADYESLVGDSREILYGLAKGHRRARGGYSKYVSLTDIVQELARQGMEYKSENALNILNSLLVDNAISGSYRPLVERATNNPRRFKLVIGLLGEHLIRQGLYHEV